MLNKFEIQLLKKALAIASLSLCMASSCNHGAENNEAPTGNTGSGSIGAKNDASKKQTFKHFTHDELENAITDATTLDGLDEIETNIKAGACTDCSDAKNLEESLRTRRILLSGLESRRLGAAEDLVGLKNLFKRVPEDKYGIQKEIDYLFMVRGYAARKKNDPATYYKLRKEIIECDELLEEDKENRIWDIEADWSFGTHTFFAWNPLPAKPKGDGACTDQIKTYLNEFETVAKHLKGNCVHKNKHSIDMCEAVEVRRKIVTENYLPQCKDEIQQVNLQIEKVYLPVE